VSRQRILLIDDEPAVRFGLRDFLETQGFEPHEADSCRQALDVFATVRPDAAVLDFRLSDGDALGLLPRLRELDPDVPVIVLTAHGSIDLAVQAMKEGAEHFLTKPIELPALLLILQRLLAARRARRRQLAGSAREHRAHVDPFLGSSPVIRELERQARKVCAVESPILIQGETGTGKGVLAAWLHRHGPRAEEAFLDLNCAGLSRELLESELFGHEKGAFTGAAARKPGLFELADGGSVFLDEIGDMDPLVQSKLLKVVEEQRFRALGAVRERHVEIRLIAATHADLSELVREGRFRSDLYFRISALPLMVPALRDRGDDVILLANSMLARIAVTLAEAHASSRQTRSKHWQRIAGPATCANCATSSSVRYCSAKMRRSRAATCASTLRRRQTTKLH